MLAEASVKGPPWLQPACSTLGAGETPDDDATVMSV